MLGPTDSSIKDGIQIVWESSHFYPLLAGSFLLLSASPSEVGMLGFLTGWLVSPRVQQMGSGALLAPAVSWHCYVSSASLLTQDVSRLAFLYHREQMSFFSPEALNWRKRVVS